MSIRVSHVLFCFLVLAGIARSQEFSDAERLFTLKVAPVLSLKCNGCHGDDPEKIKGGLIMLTREDLLKGGEEIGGDILKPGHADESFIMTAIRWEDPDFEMPPKENDRLTEEQIADVAKWIDAGAPWPDQQRQETIRLAERQRETTEDGVLIKTSGGLGDEWTYRRYQPRDVWAFRPVEPRPVPKLEEKNPVDAFVREKLKQAGFAPAPQADPNTLIRRASYDLTGLPPTPGETNAFLLSWSTDPEAAWTALIDRLLESPHYGERWGQHWLDVARYADTGGMSNDFERSNAWRYRDYVIRSFNNDKPYNAFVREQLAGDELADASVRKRLGDDPKKVHRARLKGDYTEEESEWIVATGLLRMGPWDNAMIKDAEARQIYLDDVVNSVGQTFLATTMRCLKCHDHKFDPLPTKDYYRMYAVFAGTQMAERPVPFTKEENREGHEEGRAHVKRLLDFAVAEKNKLTKKRETAARAWFEKHGLKYLTPEERKDLPDEEKPPRNVGLDHVDEGRLKVREQDEWIWERRAERYQPMAQAVYNGADEPSAWNKARKLRISKKLNPGWKPASHILTGGSLEAPGEPVGPGVLSVLNLPVQNNSGPDPFVIPEQLDDRRLAFADWVVHPKNSLATRAIVNRIWQHHFVNPIAKNPNNFGAKGGKPTHPELLDWLAADFVAHGWRMKRVHRLLMLSDTYKQAGSHPRAEKLAATDPNNRLIAYFPSRRLSAEEIRDSMLAISGELNRAVGGVPVMPEINMEVALQPRMIQFSLAPAYQPSPTPEQRNRRSIYAYRVRGQADPFMELFNQPNPNDSCEIRNAAAVTPQAFSLLNSDMSTDRAIAFARRVESEAKTVDSQIEHVFTLALGRLPTPGEKTRLTKYAADMRDYHTNHPAEKPQYPTEITRSLVEEFSGRPFEYKEILPVFENYVPDKKATDVEPATRALADVCLLMFNSNEFAYVY